MSSSNPLAAVNSRPDKQPDASKRPPIWAYESTVVQAELLIGNNGW